MSMRVQAGCIAAALLLGAALAQADVAVPELKARVTDLTSTLTAGQAAMLENKLAAFEAGKGSQIVVLIVPTTQPEEIEQYAIRVVDQWQLGRKKIDDGALLLVAKDDRAMRIEVGRGLEGALPDAIAKRIIAETITPLFKQGDIFAGIDAGTAQMMQVIQGEPLPPPPHVRGHKSGENGFNALLAPFFIFWFIGHALKRMFGVFPASALVGAGTGLAAFLMLGGLMALVTGVMAMIAALAMYSGALGGMLASMPRGGGGFGGFGGGGGGGFGGGGGGFGGGGASGRW